MTIEVTDANFEEIVLQSDKPVLVDFWAEWCGPCRMIGPLVSELADDYKDRAVITKMDVDSNPGTAAKFGIRNIPTILFFKGGDNGRDSRNSCLLAFSLVQCMCIGIYVY